MMDRAKINIHLSDEQKDIKIIDINGKNITKKKPSTYECLSTNRKEIVKGVWRMPRLSEATKDVVSCEKLRGLAHTN